MSMLSQNEKLRMKLQKASNLEESSIPSGITYSKWELGKAGLSMVVHSAKSLPCFATLLPPWPADCAESASATAASAVSRRLRLQRPVPSERKRRPPCVGCDGFDGAVFCWQA